MFSNIPETRLPETYKMLILGENYQHLTLPETHQHPSESRSVPTDEHT
jgi:hypothetical protein